MEIVSYELSSFLCRGSTLTNTRKLLARHAHHAQVADFAATAQVEHGQAHDTDLLV